MEGFSSWRKDGEGVRGSWRPRTLVPGQWAASYLFGAGVSDNLGVPSVSLLSEDAVASESVKGRAHQWGWNARAL